MPYHYNKMLSLNVHPTKGTKFVINTLGGRLDFCSSLESEECWPRGGWGGGVLPYNSYTGMFRPTGWCFWDSDLKRGIIFKLFSGTGYISNARKLQNIIGDLNIRTGAGSFLSGW